ncbi:flavin reductase family protein [Altericroceibacterium endophyticum]|uniref:Flavin reductase family protein n=1 Tax=Altericroceibacterium endophyticum TaxID=1808508 RepID=A0A6I4TA50_9SPHN|nr:flavin reductase family protein [Altericroceibacterium endophyticum]MXO67041.1 flavin reductase family protein [Altericroceibacterium endophyticum]
MDFDFSRFEAADRYKLMAASITPRPIAWISSLSKDGVRNAAPYSFFNMMSADPPLVVIGLMRRPDGSYKDSAQNILDTKEFVVNLVSEGDAEAMNFTCIDAPADFDEIAHAGLETVPSDKITPPRIASAPVSMECRLYEKVEAGKSTIVLGEVLSLHIADEFIDAEKLHVDAVAMQLVARMHGAGWYTRSTDRFQMERPRYADYVKDQG